MTRPPLSLRHGLLIAAVTAAVALPTFRVAAPPKARLIPPSATTRATGLSERWSWRGREREVADRWETLAWL